jgi:hypothetical protein
MRDPSSANTHQILTCLKLLVNQLDVVIHALLLLLLQRDSEKIVTFTFNYGIHFSLSPINSQDSSLRAAIEEFALQKAL